MSECLGRSPLSFGHLLTLYLLALAQNRIDKLIYKPIQAEWNLTI